MKTYKLGLTGKEVVEKFALLDELANSSTTASCAYGTCGTYASTAAKEIILTSPVSGWELTTGSRISVKFTYTNTASNPTFNVNGTGAKPVFYNGLQITTTNKDYAGYSSKVCDYVYDGTNWVYLGRSYDVDTNTNTTYTNASLGQGYSTCSTAASTTAKEAILSGYSLTTGGIVTIKFTNEVPANATLKIKTSSTSSLGTAKPIYYQGAAITDGVIKAGDTATFMYDGTQYQLISIDTWEDDIKANTNAISTCQTSISTCQSNISTCQTEIDECQAAIGDISTALTNIIAQTETIITRAEATIGGN